jgi:hypothetical protein
MAALIVSRKKKGKKRAPPAQLEDISEPMPDMSEFIKSGHLERRLVPTLSLGRAARRVGNAARHLCAR